MIALAVIERKDEFEKYLNLRGCFEIQLKKSGLPAPPSQAGHPLPH